MTKPSFDILLLSAFLDLRRFKSCINSVPTEALAPPTKTFLGYIAAYSKTYPDATEVDLEALKTLIALRAKGASTEQLAVVNRQLDLLKRPVDQRLLDGVVERLVELDAAGRVGSVIARYNAGDEVDLLQELSITVDAAKKQFNNSTTEFINEGIHSILEEEAQDVGIKFQLPTLQRCVKGLTGGMNVAFAGRVGQGKSSFMSSFVVHAAKQSAKLCGERPILYLINEGNARRVKPRLYSAALGLAAKEMWAIDPEELDRMYCEAIGHNDPNFIMLKQANGMTLQQVQALVEQTQPFLLLTDMTSHFGGVKAEKEYQKLEQLFIGFRDIAIENDLIHFGTLQLSFEGCDTLTPPITAVKDSKIGLQGALDLMLTMGSLDDPQFESIRGLNVVKTKVPMQGADAHPHFTVQFDPLRNHWEEVE